MKRAVLAALVLVACTDTPEPSGPFVDSRVETKDIPLRGVPRIDVLVVIERSPAMAEHVDRVRVQLPMLVDFFETLPAGVPDLHLGVITADVPNLRAAGMVSGAFIADRPLRDGTRERNYVGPMEDVFAAMIDVGTEGPATATPLATTIAALDHNPTNAGFLRPDAYLGVLIVAGTDDRSTGSVEELAAALKVTNDPTRVRVSTIAAPAMRLDAFRAQFPNRNAAASITSDDYGDAFVPLMQTLRNLLGPPCWQVATVDAECLAWTDEKTVPRCGSGMTELCWRLEAYPNGCPFGSGTVTRFANVVNVPADGVRVTMQCLISPNP